MDLLEEIKAAQRKSEVGLDQFGGRGWQRVYDAMPGEARRLWNRMSLPGQLLTMSEVERIKRYAEMCGTTWPGDEL